MRSNNDHPFLRPLWRRIVLVGFCAAWAAFEFWSGQSFWGVLFGAMAVYGAYTYLYAYEAPKQEE
jgi:hypothetical protein